MIVHFEEQMAKWFILQVLCFKYYDTLYKNSGIERPELSKDFIRDRETISKIMDEWIKKVITEYEEVKEGRSYVAIKFYTKKDEVIDDKAEE